MGNCVSSKDKNSEQNTTKPPQGKQQEQPVIEQKEEPKQEQAQSGSAEQKQDTVTVEQVAKTVVAVDEALKQNGIDVVKITADYSSKVYKDLWAMCTVENANKVMEMASAANDKLLENGIDVKALAVQAGVAVGEASIVLAQKMFEDGKVVVANAIQEAMKSPEC